MGYASSYFCFPISLTDAEILGIWVGGIQPVQLWPWPCAWLLGLREGALQWTQCYPTRRVSQVSLKALWGEAGATGALCWADSWEAQLLSGAASTLTNTLMKHNPIFLHYWEETGSLQSFLCFSSFLRKCVSITVVSLRVRDAPLLSLLVYIWNMLPFEPPPSSELFKPQMDCILLSTLFSNYMWSHPIIFFYSSDFSIFCYTSKQPCGSVSVIDHKYFL